MKKVSDMLDAQTLGNVPHSEPVKAAPQTPHGEGKYCPECGALLEHEGGCVSCRSCGYSKCN